MEPANLTLANIPSMQECKKGHFRHKVDTHEGWSQGANSSDNLDMNWLQAHQSGSRAINATNGISLACILLLV